MTLQLRPTFSESWYRVANLRAKLRAGAQISRQFYRGERWYVVRDPAGNQYHRLSDAAYRFVGLLDGTRTIEEAWELVGGTLEDDAPTQPEVIQILSHLYSANLIDADVTPDATVLLRRHKQLSKRKMQNRLMNVLFPRIPLWDPDKFLTRWMPLARIAFSRIGVLCWLAVVITAIVVLIPFWNHTSHSLQEAAKYAYELKEHPINAVYLWFVFCLIKFIHEMGHAFSCRRFGGECHELGIMFLVFIPTPYVDASSAWSFRNKWQRIFVGAAGMIVELFFASLCAFVWINTGDPHSLVGQLTFNAMLVASVTTVVFNANPLLRYDGYYILSDFLEIPNLSQKSKDYAMGLLKRHVFGVKLQQPLPPVIQRIWLFCYAIASSIYRAFVGLVIIFMVIYQIPVLGALMGIGGVITWAVVPIFKTFKYLMLDPELHRKRAWATTFTLATTAVVIMFIGLVPWSRNVDEPGVAEAMEHEAVRPGWPGVVSQILAKDNQRVKAGDIILIAEDFELDRDLAETAAEIQFYKDKMQADQSADPTIVKMDRAQLEAVQQKFVELSSRKDKLTIRAPIDGVLIAPTLNDLKGRRLERGKQIAEVMDYERLNVRVLIEQKEVGAITRHDPTLKSLRAQVRLVSDVDNIMSGPVTRMFPTDSVIGVLSSATGEDQQVDPRHPEKYLTPQYEINVQLENAGGKYFPGQKATVRFRLNKEPLMVQWYRKVLQLLQTRQANPLV